MTENKHNPCDIFVGAESGLLKGVHIGDKSWHNFNAVQEANRDKGINRLCWGDQDQTQICAGHRDGTVSIYNRQSQELVASYPDTGGNGILRGLAKLDSSIATCTVKGSLKVWQDGEEKLAIDAGENICFMQQNPCQKQLLATGGKENDLKIWNLEEPEELVFTAKNVKHDWLNLRVPVWVTDAAFIPDSQKIVTCTGYHQVRVYDPSTPQRRPVLEVEVDEYPITCMSLRHNQSQAVVGNTHGMMALVDFRGKGYMVQKYRGFAGSIRGIQYHANTDTVVSCGLDRYVRVHDINSKDLMHKMYLKSRLNCVLLADEWSDQNITTSKESEIVDTSISNQGDNLNPDDKDINDDSIWEKMEVVKTKHPKNETKKTVKSKDEPQLELRGDNAASAEEDDLDLSTVKVEDEDEEEEGQEIVSAKHKSKRAKSHTGGKGSKKKKLKSKS